MTSKPTDKAVTDPAGNAGSQASDGGSAAKGQEKAGVAFLRGYDEVARMNREALDAVVQASGVFARTYDEMGRAVFAYTQALTDMSVSAGKAMLGARTLGDVAEVQSAFARTSFDSLVAETAKLSELSLKAANEALGPLQVHLRAAMRRTVRPQAA